MTAKKRTRVSRLHSFVGESEESRYSPVANLLTISSSIERCDQLNITIESLSDILPLP